MDLTEAENINKWQEYTELYKKDLHDQDNHDGVITDLEPDILDWKVKWALGSISMNKASGGDGIAVELFQILKDDAVKVLHPIHNIQYIPLFQFLKFRKLWTMKRTNQLPIFRQLMCPSGGLSCPNQNIYLEI